MEKRDYSSFIKSGCNPREAEKYGIHKKSIHTAKDATVMMADVGERDILIITGLTLNSCRTSEETVSCFPETVISVVLNLNLPSYQRLNTVGGWAYVNEQGSGTRGLIVLRTNGGFKVYDRNAPHICPASNTTLSVVDNIKIYCPNDQAEWILLTGEPIKIAQIPPKMYSYQYNSSSNILNIYN